MPAPSSPAPVRGHQALEASIHCQPGTKVLGDPVQRRSTFLRIPTPATAAPTTYDSSAVQMTRKLIGSNVVRAQTRGHCWKPLLEHLLAPGQPIAQPGDSLGSRVHPSMHPDSSHRSGALPRQSCHLQASNSHPYKHLPHHISAAVARCLLPECATASPPAW